MAAWRPVVVYRHDGRDMHPKLAYTLPPGMGEALSAIGIFAPDPGPADLDLSAMPWVPTTVGASVLTPDDIQHPQT